MRFELKIILDSYTFAFFRYYPLRPSILFSGPVELLPAVAIPYKNTFNVFCSFSNSEILKTALARYGRDYFSFLAKVMLRAG